MARVQYGSLITDIQGSIGGFTFQKNRSGNIIRLRPSGNKKKSINQNLQQTSFFNSLKNWQNLTFANKQLWNDYALIWTKTNAFGQTKTLTGQNWYMSINQNFQQISKPTVSVPPAHILPTAPGNFIFMFNSTKLKIKFIPEFNPSNESLFIWATSPISKTSTSLQKDFRLIKVKKNGPFNEINIKNSWKNYFNIPYPPASSLDCFNIAIMIQTVHKISGLTSPGFIQNNTINQPNYGIGFMQVGTTFIIS